MRGASGEAPSEPERVANSRLENNIGSADDDSGWEEDVDENVDAKEDDCRCV